jgi:MtrB/PioB family decaheme-associated outer membrane protein
MPGLLFEASFKNQDKEGARLWGKGYDCNAAVCGTSTATAIDQTKFVKNALLFIAEPIDSTIKQIEAKFTFHDEKLAATAGYYGTFYENNNGNVKPTVPDSFNNAVGQPFPGYPAVTSAIIAGGGLSLQNVLQLPMALQPDNSAHQFYVDGNYGFTPTTKGTFKFAFTHGTQHRDFGAQGLSGAPQGSTNLDGDVDTTLAQVGFSTQPISKLSVVGSWRYERKEDKTPQFLYNVQPQTAVPAAVPPNVNSFWNNGISSNTHMGGKLDATYRLPWEYRVTVGGEFSSIEREVPPTDPQDELVAGLTAVRKKNTEAGYRLELAKNMSETLTGRIIYAASKRRGSDWTTVSTLDPATPGISAANLALINQFCGGRACYGQSLPAGAILGLSTTAIFPANMTDLDREKVKLLANWSPTDRLALNVYLEDGTDKTAATNDPIAGGKGWRDTDFRFYNVDASFLLSENWKLTGYASRGESSVQVNHSTGYIANIKSTSDAVSLGVIGRISDRIQVGGNVAYYNDVNDYNITAAPSATGAPASATNIAQAAIGLPDITLRKTAVSLFANYGLNRNSDIRVDVIHQRAEFREWVWGNNGVPFTFADNTTVSQQPNQNVTFFAAKYIYKFQ